MDYTRRQLEEGCIEHLKKSLSFAQADVMLVVIEGKTMVFKDFFRTNLLFKWLFGRVAIAREAKAYERLKGLRGVPLLIYRPDKYSLVMEYMPGSRLPRRKQRALVSPQFFGNLECLVKEMHSHGVAHGDLHKRNVFFMDSETPCILDFATSLCVDNKSSWLKRQIFKRMCRIDDLSVLKIKARYCPHSLTEDEKRALDTLPLYLRIGRFIRKSIYSPLIKPKHWNARFNRIKRFFSGDDAKS